ncbi:hypothetical protein B7Y94_00155 [Candidatus Saccharibacteria bacterium 32-49-12]|nr:MAG: hypothetical protein B7Y94_00155 [Candidatus Saccharibacteria bacterium 32-49-12]
MVDFLKIVRHKTLFSEVMYYVLNIGLAAAIFILSQTIQSPALAIAIVLLSKWRVLAVRPRYWWTNIQANTVDIIVGVSIVALMYLPQISLAAQVILALIYAIWLVIIKPLSKRWHMMVQAIFAIGLGVTALYSVSYEWPVFFVVLAMLVIGYSSARHFLYSYEEQQIVLLSAIWGLIFAEIGWLAQHWAFSYSLPGLSSLKIPQVTVIVLLLSFVSERVYRSWFENKRVVPADVTLPVVFSALLILVILLFFNSVTI